MTKEDIMLELITPKHVPTFPPRKLLRRRPTKIARRGASEPLNGGLPPRKPENGGNEPCRSRLRDTICTTSHASRPDLVAPRRSEFCICVLWIRALC
jgi:hypothetical protein